MHLLIPAAGLGQRMSAAWVNRGADQRNKLLLTVLGKPILAWTLLAAESAQSIEWIGIIAQPTDWPDIQNILQQITITKPLRLIVGGTTRQESVYCGLQALPPEATAVLIHDGARCLGSATLIDRCAQELNTCEGLVAAIPVKDTIKVVDQHQIVTSTPDRSNLWAAQTPQGFKVQLLKDCHEQGQKMGWSVTDDAALFERCQIPVKIVMGEETNLKVTTPADLALAELILNQRSEIKLEL
jgi:2-C-methyl-D-erythritol 4-phosphate cytidylyltransferase